MNDFIENNIKKTKLMLEYYGYGVTEAEAFMLADLYKLRFDYESAVNSNPAETAAFRMLFFINHFVSHDSYKFRKELYEMKVTKNYPFLVICRCCGFNRFYTVMGVRRKDKKIIALNEDNEMIQEDFEDLEKKWSGHKVEWWVIMPPQKKVSVSECVDQALYKSVRYMLNMIKAARKDYFFSTNKLERYIEAISEIAGKNDDSKLAETVARYMEITAHGGKEDDYSKEESILREMYDYLGQK